jgi:uncharacterized protein YacL
MKRTKFFIRVLLALAGAYIGFQLLSSIRLLYTMLQWDSWLGVEPWRYLAADISSIIFIGFISFLLAPLLISAVEKLIHLTELILQKLPLEDVIIGAIGLSIGLLLANLMGLALMGLPVIGVSITIGLNVIFGFVGARLALYQKKDILRVTTMLRRERTEVSTKVPSPGELPTSRASEQRGKLLDTSVIIDGRIADLCATGFLEGPLVVPLFVLSELQLLSDSADPIKRARGRRGFDILNRIQKEINFPVIISEKDYENENAVDTKLVKLSQETGYKLLTLDYNLNKMSVLQQVQVLNINDLANALRTIVLPGEGLNVTIIKIGREQGQGIAYLDDGTMVVVDGASRMVGKTVMVEVTTSLQTSAGRMIFAKISN